jgi:hypothetical protein
MDRIGPQHGDLAHGDSSELQMREKLIRLAPLALRRRELSPDRPITPYELARYLDYCSEMLSPTAKVAVLYAQSFPDPIVTEAVNDIERTSASLGQKIWQKINIVERVLDRTRAPAQETEA